MTNFKSYQGEHRVPLSWVNIVAGANSSGKSTLIQSILLMKQTLQYGSKDKSLLLNGPIQRLGSFSNVINSASSSSNISLGLECRYSREEMREIAAKWHRRNSLFVNPLQTTEYISDLSLSATWSDASDAAFDEQVARKFSPNLDLVQVNVTKSVKEGFAERSIALTRDAAEGTLATFGVEMDTESRIELFHGLPSPLVRGGYVDKFLPQYVVIQYDLRARKAQEISTVLFERGWAFATSSNQYNGTSLPKSVIYSVQTWLHNHGNSVIFDENVTVKQARDEIEKVIPQAEFFSSNKKPVISDAELADIRAAINTELVASLALEHDFEFVMASSLREGVSLLSDYFTSAVLYLGPLRDAPRPVYQVEALPSATDVGYRGEHTAAVLDLNKNVRLQYIAPPADALTDDYISSATTKRATLHDAVVEWLSYLGVAEEVQTEDEGVFGNRLQVKTSSGGDLHDLTNVGVGVSQVLPIVVMALLAPPGSLLIFEQPELYLHPKVQARLADFFLSLSLRRTQVLAETHSEYMIDRLRLRVALSDDEEIIDRINILFSERDAGCSKLIPIELTSFGSVVSWPKDFFDQSQGDVARILAAGAAKRRARREA